MSRTPSFISTAAVRGGGVIHVYAIQLYCRRGRERILLVYLIQLYCTREREKTLLVHFIQLYCR